MADEKQEKDVPIVTEKPVDEDIVYANLDDIKGWQRERTEKAEPFRVPGTNKYFLIATADMSAAYKAITVELESMKENSADWLEAVNDALLKACVLNPVLDDEAIAVLKSSDCKMVSAIIRKCREVSGLDEGTVGAENFS